MLKTSSWGGKPFDSLIEKTTSKGTMTFVWYQCFIKSIKILVGAQPPTLLLICSSKQVGQWSSVAHLSSSFVSTAQNHMFMQFLSLWVTGVIILPAKRMNFYSENHFPNHDPTNIDFVTTKAPLKLNLPPTLCQFCFLFRRFALPLLRNGYCPYKEVVASGPAESWVLGQEKCSTHLSHENNPPTFHYTGWLIGILIMVYYNPYITG